MGQTLGSLLQLQAEVSDVYEKQIKFIDKIRTRVHPLNTELCSAVVDSVSESEGRKIIFSQAERPRNQIKLLCFNTLMLPLYPKDATYQSAYQYERLADMFEVHFNKFDIVCLQEMFGVFTSELKEMALAFGQKAGFLYHAPARLCEPKNHSLYFGDCGLLILSRFPIIEMDFQQFSLGVFADGEVQRGTLYAKIEVQPGKHLQVFTLHTQCTNYNYAPECIEISRHIRNTSMTELAAFMASKVREGSPKSTMILTGDFNIIRYPMGQHYLAKIFGLQPKFIDYLKLVESEYEHLVATLSKNGTFQVTNCWDRDNPGKVCVTAGDSREGKDGTLEPLETTFTASEDQLLQNCFDYIFLIEAEKDKSGSFKTLGTTVEKMFVEKGSVRLWDGQPREYSQLSDHYGLSTCLQLN